MTVYWVVWDAAAYWIVDRLDRQGALPAVRRLRGAGVTAAARPPGPNCQTPPALATLFTGTSTREHGITGFTAPEAGSVTAHRSGFELGLLATPPVWQTLAGYGRRGVFVHVPWVSDRAPDGGPAPGVDAVVEAYRDRLARHDTVPVTRRRQSWPVGEYGEYEVEVRGTLLRAPLGCHELGGEPGWVPVPLPDGAGFWARYLPTAHGGPVLVRTGTWRMRAGGSDRRLVADLAGLARPAGHAGHAGHAGLTGGAVFAGEGVGSLYRAGLFGPRLAEGGDGSAEDVFLSSVDCVVRSFSAATERILAGHRADLVVIYLPWTDDVGHELAGLGDERSAAHRPDIAEPVWRRMLHCYRRSDAVLEAVLDRAGADDTVILSADHGIAGCTHLVHVNEALIGAGLAARASDGGLDTSRSAVVYHPANNGLLRVNHDGLPGGWVPGERAGATMALAMAALREITGPGGDRRSVVAGFLDERGAPLAGPDPGADAYLVLADDYQPSAVVDGDAVVRATAKSGGHVVNTGSDRLHAIFAAAGPTLPAGADLGVVDNTVAARLVLHQFGAADPPAELLAPTSSTGSAGSTEGRSQP